eukprot:2337782-Rhodomonas_salina.2
MSRASLSLCLSSERPAASRSVATQKWQCHCPEEADLSHPHRPSPSLHQPAYGGRQPGETRLWLALLSWPHLSCAKSAPGIAQRQRRSVHLTACPSPPAPQHPSSPSTPKNWQHKPH